MQNASDATLKTADLARALGVDVRTIRYWMSEETPKHRRLVPDIWTPGGHARFTEATRERLVAQLRKRRPRAA